MKRIIFYGIFCLVVTLIIYCYLFIRWKPLGMAGTCMLYVMSIWLCRLPYYEMVQTLSKGSILIIGLHIIIVRRLAELANRVWLEDLLLSVLVLFAFIPFIRIAELYFPLILGRHNSQRK